MQSIKKIGKEIIFQYRSSLRLQVMMSFAISMLAGILVAVNIEPYSSEQHVVINYKNGMENIDNDAQRIVRELENFNEYITNPETDEEKKSSQTETPTGTEESSGTITSANPPDVIGNTATPGNSLGAGAYVTAANAITNPVQKLSTEERDELNELVDSFSRINSVDIILMDLDGNIAIKSKNVHETKIDVHTLIRSSMDKRINSEDDVLQQFTTFYPIDLLKEKMYVVVRGIPHPELIKTYLPSDLPGFIGFVVFIFCFFFLTKKKMLHIRNMASGIRAMATGDLDVRVPVNSIDELGQLAENINNMAMRLNDTIEEERRAEQTKNELITNVSHDLRTPLTSIMGYLRLIQDKRYRNEEQLAEYAEIAYMKSEQLKRLIEDLFEYTKLTNEGVTIYRKQVDLTEMLEQLLEELVPQIEEEELHFKKQVPSERVNVEVDPDKIVRVFENLLGNAIKYSDKPGEILVRMKHDEYKVTITVANKAESLGKKDLDKLFDRFYKADESRHSVQDGSGLGLAISKSIVELHGGKIWANAEGDAVYFHVELKKMK